MGEVAGEQLQNLCTAHTAHVMIKFKIKVPYVIDNPTCVYRNPQTVVEWLNIITLLPDILTFHKRRSKTCLVYDFNDKRKQILSVSGLSLRWKYLNVTYLISSCCSFDRID